MEQFNTDAELPTAEEVGSAEKTAARELVMMGFEQVHLDAITRVNRLGFEQIMNMVKDPEAFKGAKEILEELKSDVTKANDVIKRLEKL